MVSRWKMGDISSQRQEDEMPNSCWGCSGKTTTPSPLLMRIPTAPRRHTCKMSWWLLAVVVAMVAMLKVGPCTSLEARCPTQDKTDSYCQCDTELVRSGIQLNIKCDYQMKEDVVLTENLYPFRGFNALRASVRISNATSVKVTQGFLGEWLKILSVALDLWNCGTVSLSSAPPIDLHYPHSFSTFFGIGLVGCRVPEIPASLLRDRVTASLLIRHSVVSIVRRGVLNAVRKMQYIVLEDSVVEEVEGSLAAEGYFTLSQMDEHRWNGLVLTNVTMRSLGPGSFNITYKANVREHTHKVEVKDCKVGQVSRGGITVQGDVAVTIKDNKFGKLEDGALKISVSRDFKFEGNVVEASREGALRGVECQNLTTMETNMIYITREASVPEILDTSFNPFSASCDQSQMSRVVNIDLPFTMTVLSSSTWILLAILLLLLLAAGGILYRWRVNNKLQNHNQNSFNSFNGVASTARYQANPQEVNMVQDAVTNPLYYRTPL